MLRRPVIAGEFILKLCEQIFVMKIASLGSMTFAKQMKDTKAALEVLGHEAVVPVDTEMCIANPTHIDDLDADYKHCVEKNIMREQFKIVESADAVLVLNYRKNDVEGYVGTSSLMEVGLAHHLGKKIFLLNKVPKPNEARWAHEVRIMQPTTILGDLKKIK